jgi:hypothetical protein
MIALLLTLATLSILVTVILPILKFYILAKAKERIKEQSKSQEMNFKELQQLKEIYVRERKEYYLEARELFNSLCKQGAIHGEDLVLLRKLLEESLGEYAKDYKGYKFDNEFKRIYVYMKSWHIEVRQWKQIIDFLNKQFEREVAL